MEKLKIIIADDHQLFVEGLSLILKDEPDLSIIDIAYSGEELLDLLRKVQTDLVLLDINMPKINGLEALGFIKKSYSRIKVIMLSTYFEDHLIEKARTLGANGYILKNADTASLKNCIRKVAAGESFFANGQNKSENYFSEEDSFIKQFNVTKREKEILLFIKQGFTNQNIADNLHLSIYTVQTHRKNIMHKLKLSSPSALIKFVIENNI